MSSATATAPRFVKLSPRLRNDIKRAVSKALRYWPNSHLGACTAREDIRSAFFRLRRDARFDGMRYAIARLEDDASRYADM